MNDNQNDDPIFSMIRDKADLIRYICGSNDSYGTDAWTKGQLSQMLNLIQSAIDDIIKATGVHDTERHYTKIIERGGPAFEEIDRLFQPYSEVGAD